MRELACIEDASKPQMTKRRHAEKLTKEETLRSANYVMKTNVMTWGNPQHFPPAFY